MLPWATRPTELRRYKAKQSAHENEATLTAHYSRLAEYADAQHGNGREPLEGPRYRSQYRGVLISALGLAKQSETVLQRLYA